MSEVKWSKDKKRAEYPEGIHYVLHSGMYFHSDTPLVVMNLLLLAYRLKAKVRIYLGDAKTGRDWHEENDVQGFIGCSGGPLKVPLLLEPGAIGGGALSDNCIVKLKMCNNVIYQHPLYNTGKFKIRKIKPGEKCGGKILLDEGYTAGVDLDGSNHANFRTVKEAAEFVKFMTE